MGGVVNLLKALAVGALTYFLIFLALIISPLIFLLAAWAGLSLLLAAFMFFFWLLITHRPTELEDTLILLVWGVPPFLLLIVLISCWDLVHKRRQQTVSLGQDEPFCQ